MTAAVLSHSTLPGLNAAGWQPTRRARLMPMLAVAALHLLGGLLLWQGGQALHRVIKKAPVQVALIQEAPPPPPLPRTAPRVEAPPLPNFMRVPVPEIQVQTREATAMPLAPPPPPPAVQTQTAPQPSPTVLTPPSPPAPKAVAASTLRWRTEPAVEVPRLSRRAGESGRVLLRVVFDVQGVPREVHIHKSSGFPRLDAQALEAMRVARITPFLEEGRPIEVVATAVIDYELE